MNKSTYDQDSLSRSALAEKLGLALKDLTQLMVDAGWIQQQGKQWLLTAKGEFEGGQYRQSAKYGQYIVWPSTIVEHPVIRDADAGLVTVSSLVQPLALPPRLLNRLLAELGWLEAFARGWQVTALGKAYGGVQCHDTETAVPYVMWPRAIQQQPGFQQAVAWCQQSSLEDAISGHPVTCHEHGLLANWLYLLG